MDMSWESMIRILFFVIFCFLAVSMFFNRIFPRFGYIFPSWFIGVQIGSCVLAIFLHGMMAWGAGRALLFIALSTSIGFGAEWLGMKTGMVFGRYRYTEKSGPRLFKTVPVFVPLMWCVIAYVGFWTARMIFPNGATEQAVFIGTASMLATAWDMVADPVVVHEGAWIWERPGEFYGVPVTNFLGWFVTAAVIFAAFTVLGGKSVFKAGFSPWMGWLPAAGYVILTGVFSYAAFERKLVLPGTLGVAVMLACAVVLGVRVF
jgi:uncharacterized membrane protein